MTLPPSPHGGDVRRIARRLGRPRDQIIDVSASLNPFAPDVATVVGRRLDRLGDYPDPEPAARALAAAISVDPDRLVVTNGGAEAIALVAAELGAGEIVDPEFSLYRQHLSAIRAGAGRWRSNPSNPLGVLADGHETAAVWDEAFWPLATGTWTRGDDASWRLGSLTKVWACPGLRLGYLIAPTVDAARCIVARQPDWSVNGLAAAVVEPLLEMTDLAAWAKTIAEASRQFGDQLSALGLETTTTAANWVLVRSERPLRDILARHGVLVRDCASFGLTGTFRVAVPRREQIERVVAAFTAAVT